MKILIKAEKYPWCGPPHAPCLGCSRLPGVTSLRCSAKKGQRKQSGRQVLRESPRIICFPVEFATCLPGRPPTHWAGEGRLPFTRARLFLPVLDPPNPLAPSSTSDFPSANECGQVDHAAQGVSCSCQRF